MFFVLSKAVKIFDFVGNAFDASNMKCSRAILHAPNAVKFAEFDASKIEDFRMLRVLSASKFIEF